jgi:S-adenosylmethionine/arginine decarboxylase-like enzyme
MLCPKIHRQRASIEFYTNKNLYDSDVVELLLENFLYDLTATLGMTIIVEPIVKTVGDGASAYVMFQESGCHVHSWFEHKFVTVDLYSCKPYMVSDVLDVIDYWFEPTKVEIV